MAAQLIPLGEGVCFDSLSQAQLKEEHGLIPKWCPHVKNEMYAADCTLRKMRVFVEVVVVGVRELAPYNFQEIQAPFVELHLDSMGTVHKQTTVSE